MRSYREVFCIKVQPRVTPKARYCTDTPPIDNKDLFNINTACWTRTWNARWVDLVVQSPNPIIGNLLALLLQYWPGVVLAPKPRDIFIIRTVITRIYDRTGKIRPTACRKITHHPPNHGDNDDDDGYLDLIKIWCVWFLLYYIIRRQRRQASQFYI